MPNDIKFRPGDKIHVRRAASDFWRLADPRSQNEIIDPAVWTVFKYDFGDFGQFVWCRNKEQIAIFWACHCEHIDAIFKVQVPHDIRNKFPTR